MNTRCVFSLFSVWYTIIYYIFSVGGLHNQDGLFGVNKPPSVPGNHGDSNHDTASPALIKSEYDDTSALESPRSAVPSLLLAESTVNNQQATDATTDATMPTLRYVQTVQQREPATSHS